MMIPSVVTCNSCVSPEYPWGYQSLAFSSTSYYSPRFLKIAVLWTSNKSEVILHLFLAIHSYSQFNDILKTFVIRKAMWLS